MLHVHISLFQEVQGYMFRIRASPCTHSTDELRTTLFGEFWLSVSLASRSTEALFRAADD
jgi:hypothetical protein